MAVYNEVMTHFFHGTSLLAVLLVLLCGCNKRIAAKEARVAKVSEEAVVVKQYTPEQKKSYELKINQGSRHQLIITKDTIKKMKLELVLYTLRSVQNVIGAVPIPFVSQGINFTLDRTVDTYYVLEGWNKSLERKTGMSVEIEENSAGLEFKKSF